MTDPFTSAIHSYETAETGSAREATISQFWQQWQEHRDLLYGCCLQYTNRNAADAEDVLSQAMLKAWEQVQKYAGHIANFKAWLVQLTRNFCIDWIRQRSRSAVAVEDLEWVGNGVELETASGMKTPEAVLEKDEKSHEIKRAIASLPELTRSTFILHFYEELSHTEIVERQGISYDSVCKRISRARKKLKQMLSPYFIDLDGSVLGMAEIADTNGSRQKMESSDLESARDKVSTPAESIEEQKREEPEVLKRSTAPKNSQGLETMTVWAASEECVEVDVAEKSELVDGAGSFLARVGEKIADVAPVCGENPLSPMMPVMLSPSMLDRTWAGCGSSSMTEGWREGLIWRQCVIKLNTDYFCHPLWWATPGKVGNIDPETLPLSSETKQQLKNWSNTYNSILNLDGPAASGFVDEETRNNFEREGICLWMKLKQELEANYEVVYFSEKLQKVLNSPRELEDRDILAVVN